MKIFYLHGLGSTGTSDKSAALIKAFGTKNVIAPDLPLDPEQTISLVTALVTADKKEKFIFVGTSLGGFWANYFGQMFQSECVIVNPMLIPGDAFVSRIGTIVTNYTTGEKTEITTEIVKSFKSAQTEVMSPNLDLITMFLAADDDVIDYRTTLEQLPGVDTYITEDGGHRYETHWDNVVALTQMLA